MSDRPPLLQNFASPRVWLSLALLAFAFVDLQRSAAAAPGIDFYQFWLVSKGTWRDGIHNVYEPGGRRAVGEAGLHAAREHGGREQAAAEFDAQVYANLIEPTATPTLYALTRLHVTGDYERDLARFQLLSNLAGAAAIVLFARRCGMSWCDGILAAGVLGVAFSPLRSDLSHANTARLQLLMLAVPAMLLGRNCAARSTIAGALIGLAVMYKPNIAAAAILLPLASRDVRAAVGLVAGVIGGLAIGAVAMGGADAWPAWWRALRALDYPPEMGNCGGGVVLASVTGMKLGPLVFFITLVSAALVSWRSERRNDPVFAIAAGCLVMLVSSSLAWVHYYVLALPMALYLLRPAATQHATGWDVTRQALATLALAAMARVPITAALGDASQRQLAIGYVAAAFVLLIVGLYDHARVRPDEPAGINPGNPVVPSGVTAS
jgi:hypothetical protein